MGEGVGTLEGDANVFSGKAYGSMKQRTLLRTGQAYAKKGLTCAIKVARSSHGV